MEQTLEGECRLNTKHHNNTITQSIFVYDRPRCVYLVVVAELRQEGLDPHEGVPLPLNAQRHAKHVLLPPEQHHELELELVQQMAFHEALAGLADDVRGVHAVREKRPREDVPSHVGVQRADVER